MATARRATVHVPALRQSGGKHLTPVALHEQGIADGARVWPQVTPRPLTMQFTLADPYSLNVGTVFGALLQEGREARIAAYRDPAWRRARLPTSSRRR